VISCIYTVKYALKVKKNPAASVMSDGEKQIAIDAFAKETLKEEDMVLTPSMKRTLYLFAFSFVIMIVALVPWQDYGINIFQGWSSFLTDKPFGKWYFNELDVWFLLMAIVAGKLNGLTEKKIMRLMVLGAGDLMGAALITGVSRGVSVIMGSTGFNTYLLQVGTNALSGVNASMFSTISYLLYSGFTFLIVSTSGLASATIPTMGALAHSLGFAPELMITTYIAAHHIVGVIPTSGTVMSALGVSKIEYPTWVKFYGKLYLMVSIFNIIVIGIFMSMFRG